jgi:hypothetical protein
MRSTGIWQTVKNCDAMSFSHHTLRGASEGIPNHQSLEQCLQPRYEPRPMRVLKGRRAAKFRYLLDPSSVSSIISSIGVAKVAAGEKHVTHAGCGGSSVVSGR